MADQEHDQANGQIQKTPAQALAGERRVLDKRAPWRVWIPTYVLRNYALKIGPSGLAVYLSLAWHSTRESPIRWPSLAQIGERAGCSRSTVVRVLKELTRFELVEVTPRNDPTGQKSHLITLIDPPEEREQTGSQGTDSAGVVNLTAPPCQPDSAPLSDWQGGAVNLTAPSIENCILNYGGRNAPPALPGAVTDQNPSVDPCAAVCAIFNAQTTLRGSARKAEVAAEIAAEVAELLRQGFSAAELVASIEDPKRDRAEYPREWRARFKAEKNRPVSEPAEERVKRLRAAAEEDRRRTAAPELVQELIRERLRVKLDGRESGQNRS